MLNALALAAKAAFDVPTEPPQGYSNVTEWAKKPECWVEVRKQPVRLPNEFIDELKPIEHRISEPRRSAAHHERHEGLNVQSKILADGMAYWRNLYSWAKQRGNLSPTEERLLQAIFRPIQGQPSTEQSKEMLKIGEKAEREGYLTGRFG